VPGTDSDELAAQEAECREWGPFARQFAAPNGCDTVMRHRLAGALQEIRISPHLLGAPFPIIEGSGPAAVDIGDAVGAPDRHKYRPEGIVIGAADADEVSHWEKVPARRGKSSA